MKKIALVCFFNLISSGLSFGQITEDEQRSAAMEAQIKRTNEQSRTMENRRTFPARVGMRYEKLTKEQKKQITPSPENIAKYKKFLESSKQEF